MQARPGGSPHPEADPLIAIRHIVFVGLMGSGKSTVGRIVAGRLGRAFRDSDAEIEARTGRTVREIREVSSTEAMHDLEASQLLDAVAGPGPDVLAVAASIADRDDCLAALRAADVRVVWLDVDPLIEAQRFGLQSHRPSFGVDPAVFLAAQRAERGPRFASVATLVLEVGSSTPDDLADQVIRGLTASALG